MGTLVMYTAVGTRTISVAQAQQLPNAAASRPDVAGRSSRFDIPPGPLDEVLPKFEQLTGIRVVLAEKNMGTLPSPGVSGLATPQAALKQMLANTGLTYRFTAPAAVRVELESRATSIEVTERIAAVTSPKYTEPLRDTPQSVSVVSQQLMQDQGVTTLRDTLRNVAGISLAAGEGGAQGDNLTIRGFTARNDIFNDGMRDFGSYYRDPFNLEEVEVLKGPSSVVFGRGTTGGVLNQASKTPQTNRFLRGDIDFGTDRTRRVTADLNQALPSLGNGAAFRLNLMGHDSDVAGRDVAENRRFGLAPSLALGLGSRTRLILSYFHQSQDDIPDYGIPWLLNGPAPVNRANYYGFEDGNYLRTNADIGTVRYEHDFEGSITIRNQARYANYQRDVRITEARVLGTVTPSTPLASILVNRGQIAVKSAETFLVNQFDATARARTGFVRHTIVSGVEAARETSDPTRPTFSNVPATSLLSPDTSQPFSGVSAITSRVHTGAKSVGAYLLDTMKLGEHWEFSGGVRWDRFDADYRQWVAPLSAFQRVDNMTSWRGAAVYKPCANGSIYFDYGTSFNPSAEALSLSSSTSDLAPEKNRTFELGSKWDISSGRLALRGSLFRTEKTNAREPDPNNALLNVLAGSQRVQGMEFEATGRMTNHWQVMGSYALMDSRLTRSQYYTSAIGSRLANVPRNTFSLWNNIDLPWHFTLGGGGQFVDTRTASSTAPIDPATGLTKEVPSYWVFHAMARYPVAQHLDLQLNAFNLTNRYYYDQLHPGHIVPGPGRAVMMGARFKF
jgi:catecholate siderophore receptor